MNSEAGRYDRQIAFAGLGLEGQRRLRAGGVLVVGVGGLGSWMAELLTRAGVGRLRLVDDDAVDRTNLHRQALYDDADAARRRPKVEAAAERLSRINPDVQVEPIRERLDAANVARLAGGADAILDGTDNFESRFVMNDYCVKASVPWVFAGVVGAEAQTMTVVPGKTACLRCVFDAPPPVCVDPSCRAAGVLGPAVAAVAAVAAMEVLKLLAGAIEAVSPYLLKLDLWTNRSQRIATGEPVEGCPCCGQGRYDYLDA